MTNAELVEWAVKHLEGERSPVGLFTDCAWLYRTWLPTAAAQVEKNKAAQKKRQERQS